MPLAPSPGVLLGGSHHGEPIPLPAAGCPPRLQVPVLRSRSWVELTSEPIPLSAVPVPPHFETELYNREKVALPFERRGWDLVPGLEVARHPLLQRYWSCRHVWVHDSFRSFLAAAMEMVNACAARAFEDVAADVLTRTGHKLDAWHIYRIAKREPRRLASLLGQVHAVELALDQLDAILAGEAPAWPAGHAKLPEELVILLSNNVLAPAAARALLAPYKLPPPTF